MIYKIPIGTDLSYTAYRAEKVKEDCVYIDYRNGYIGKDWEKISQQEEKEIAPEWFGKMPIEPTPLTEQEEISIDTALNVEYMVCLMEETLGLE